MLANTFRCRKSIISLLIIMLIITAACKTHYDTTKENKHVIKDKKSIARGENLVYNVCAQCHYDRQYKNFAGEAMRDLPAIMGKVYSADLRHGGIVDNYTDGELAYLLKTGITREGKFIPYMVRPTMADADVNDIIAFLRSDNEALQGNNPPTGKTKLSLIGKMAIGISGKPTPFVDNIPLPDEKNTLAYGYYLVDIIGCYHCHSKSITGLDYEHPNQSKGYMQGGMKWKIDDKKIYASNLTPHKATGIGKYSEEAFKKAVKEKIALDGRTLQYPMRKYPHLTDMQIAAMYAYLMSLPAKAHQVKGHNDY